MGVSVKVCCRSERPGLVLRVGEWCQGGLNQQILDYRILASAEVSDDDIGPRVRVKITAANYLPGRVKLIIDREFMIAEQNEQITGH